MDNVMHNAQFPLLYYVTNDVYFEHNQYNDKVIRTFPMDNVMHNAQFPLLYYVTNGNPT